MTEQNHLNNHHEEIIKNTAEAVRNFSEQVKSPEVTPGERVEQLEKHLEVSQEHLEHIETTAQHFEKHHYKGEENQLLRAIDGFVEMELDSLNKDKFIGTLLVRVEELVKQGHHEEVLTYLFLKAKHKYQTIHSPENVDYAA